MPTSRDPVPNLERGSVDETPHVKSPMSLGVEWVARITGVALVMVLPGIAGHWLDSWIGVSFLTLVGFVFGFIAGFVALLAMVKPNSSRRNS